MCLNLKREAMKKTIFILAFSMVTAIKAQDGWVKYNEQISIKVFENQVLAYDEAKEFCENESDGTYTVSIVTVKEPQMQALLVSQTSTLLNSVWLGAKCEVGSSACTWADGGSISDTDVNWDNGPPTYPITGAALCVEMATQTFKQSTKATKDKWTAVDCARKRNVVICQRTGEMDFAEEIRQIKEQLKNMADTVLPVGSIYVEYPGQESPEKLWPDLEWEDITKEYAGLFFRANGNESAAFGEIQEGCAPRITRMEYQEKTADPSYPTGMDIPDGAWSEYGAVGAWFSTGTRWYEGLRFNTTTCEVRPRNQSIRLWRRQENAPAFIK